MNAVKTQPQPIRVLVIGIGDSMYCDAGVGIHIAREIAANRWPGVMSLAVKSLTADLAQTIAQAKAVIFVNSDLAPEITRPAPISMIQIEPPKQMGLEDAANTLSGTPPPTPEGLLGITLSRHGHVPAAMLVSVPGTNFGPGDQISSIAAQGAELALHMIGLYVVQQSKAQTDPCEQSASGFPMTGHLAH